ncbi:MAG: CARDB domain-containing protein [Candidatus Micrarchaeia archaeon]
MRSTLLALLFLACFASAAIVPGKSGTTYKDNPDFPPTLLELAEIFWDHDNSGYADGDYYPIYVSDKTAFDKRNPFLLSYLQNWYGSAHSDAFKRNALDAGGWAGGPPRAEYRYVPNAAAAFSESRVQAHTPSYYSGTYKPTPTELIRAYTKNPHWIKGMPYIFGGSSIEDIYGFVEDAGWSGTPIEVIGDAKDVATFAIGYVLYFAFDIPGFYKGLYEKMLEGEKKKKHMLLRAGVYGPAGLVMVNEERTAAFRRVEDISASHARGSGAWIRASQGAVEVLDGIAGKTVVESTGGWKAEHDDTVLAPASGSFDSAVIYWDFILEVDERGGDGDFAGHLQLVATDSAGGEHVHDLAGANKDQARWSPAAGDRRYFVWSGVTTVKAGDYGTAKLKALKLSSTAATSASKGNTRAVAYLEFYPLLYERLSMDLRPTSALNKTPPVEGENITVDAWIENVGDVNALDVLAVLKDGATELGWARLNISANTAAKASFGWQPSAGNHTLSLEVVSEGGEWGVPDANRSNNILRKDVRVYAAGELLPDLAVTDIGLPPVVGGVPATLTVTIQNKGVATTAGHPSAKAYFYVDGKKVLIGEVLPLAPGANTTLPFSHTFEFRECDMYKRTNYNISVQLEPGAPDADASNNELSKIAAVSAPDAANLVVLNLFPSKGRAGVLDMKVGQTTEIEVQVGNNGLKNSSLTDLRLFRVVGGERWEMTSWLLPKISPAGPPVSFYYNWSPPARGDYEIEAHADYGKRITELCETDNVRKAHISVELAYHNVSLGCWQAGSLKDACFASAAEEGGAYKQITFYPDIGNTGTLPGTYRVTAQLPAGWSGAFSKEWFDMTPKSAEAFRYFVTPPANALGGNNTITLTAALAGNASVTDNTVLTVFIPEHFAANLSATSTRREVRVNETAVFDVTLTNTGNTRDTEFFVWFGGDLTANASISSVRLSAGESRSFTVAATPPELTAGNYSLTVFAGTTEATLANLSLTITVKPFYEISVDVPRAYAFVNLTSYFGRHATAFNFTVRVKSNADGRVTNELAGVPGEWLAAAWPDNHTFEAYTKARWRGPFEKAGQLYVGVFPDFSPPFYQPLAGNRTFTLTTRLFDDRGALVKSIPNNFVVEVEQVHAVRAGFYAVFSGLRNHTIPVYVAVTNLGNGRDDFNLTVWTEHGWTVRVPNPRIRLAPYQLPGSTGMVFAEVSVPADAVPGTNETLHARAERVGRPATNHTAEGILRVRPLLEMEGEWRRAYVSHAVLPNATTSYEMRLFYNGDVPAEANLSAALLRASPAGWNHSLSAAALNLTPLSHQAFRLSVRAPDAEEGNHSLNITARVGGESAGISVFTIIRRFNLTLQPGWNALPVPIEAEAAPAAPAPPAPEAWCTDSDNGRDRLVKGRVKIPGGAFTDYCISSDAVHEFYCADNNYAFEDIPCLPDETCQDGRCVKKAEEEAECPPSRPYCLTSQQAADRGCVPPPGPECSPLGEWPRMCWWCPTQLQAASYSEPVLLLAPASSSLKSFTASQLAALLQAQLPRGRVVEITSYANGSFQHFIVGITPPNASEDFSLEPGSAYWARIEGEGAAITLPAQATAELSLQPGWNFVSVPAAARASQAFPAATQVSLWRPAEQAFADFIPGFHPPLGEGDLWLVPGDAVWIFSGERARPQAEAAVPLPHAIYGVVSEDGTPAEGAGVTLIIESTGEALHALTDAQGRFSINLANARSGYYDGGGVRILASKGELFGQSSLIVDASRPNQRADLALAAKPNLRITLAPSKPAPVEGEPIALAATLSNEGGEPANASAGLFIDGQLAETKNVLLSSHSAQQLLFAWNASAGAHVIVVKAEPLPLEAFLEDNSANATVSVMSRPAVELAPPPARLCPLFLLPAALALLLFGRPRCMKTF